LAGWHNDLNLLTIHGSSRYPGLHAWLRDGTRVAVKIPKGGLLVQAGQQMEHLTAGAVQVSEAQPGLDQEPSPPTASSRAASRIPSVNPFANL
jgi:hypothetical protein